MGRDEFRKMAHEIRIALGCNYMEQLEEMVSAYDGVTRWNERLRAELEELRGKVEDGEARKEESKYTAARNQT